MAHYAGKDFRVLLKSNGRLRERIGEDGTHMKFNLSQCFFALIHRLFMMLRTIVEGFQELEDHINE